MNRGQKKKGRILKLASEETGGDDKRGKRDLAKTKRPWGVAWKERAHEKNK